MKRKNKKEKSIILRIFALLVCAYFIVSLTNLWQKYNDLISDLNKATAELNLKQSEVQELKSILNADSDKQLIEKAARERLGYIYYGEQVFIDISGN